MHLGASALSILPVMETETEDWVLYWQTIMLALTFCMPTSTYVVDHIPRPQTFQQRTWWRSNPADWGSTSVMMCTLSCPVSFFLRPFQCQAHWLCACLFKFLNPQYCRSFHPLKSSKTQLKKGWKSMHWDSQILILLRFNLPNIPLTVSQYLHFVKNQIQKCKSQGAF